jgi:CRISPR/Cas system-associated exonuclease Cas4 (RecB family)
MSYRTFNASEIDEYLYCHRAWWLRHMRGRESYNLDEMKAGNDYHDEHQQAVRRTTAAARLALIFIFIVAGFVTFWLVSTL